MNDALGLYRCGCDPTHDDCVCGCHEPHVGQQVQFTENAEHPRVLGTVSRVWPNGRYVTIISDGRTFTREIARVVVCR